MLLGRDRLKQLLDQSTLRAWRYQDGKEVRLRESDLVIGTNSIDVTLADQFARISPAQGHDAHIDPYDPMTMAVNRFQASEVIMYPGQTLLGCTRERFAIGTVSFLDTYCDVAPMYDGRSTCGRLFLASHITAGYGDVGFESAWTLELKNMGEHPLKIHAGMRIGQVSFNLVYGGVGSAYDGSYTDQHRQPKPPSLGRNRF